MIKREEGFTLVELMITMVVFVFVIAGASGIFTSLLTQFKQQSRISESNIEGVVGLEMLRRDIESAGYGLPWNTEIDGDGDGNDWELLKAYCEAISDAKITPNPTTFNNGIATSPCPTTAASGGTQPRAIFSGNNSGFNGADYLVIRATSVGTDDAARKWTYLREGNNLNTWTPACENVNRYPVATDTDCSTGASLDNAVRVIVISPGGSTAANTRSLIDRSSDAGVFFTRYNDTAPNNTAEFAPPAGSTEPYIVYGVNRTTDLRVPFNRADYHISTSKMCSDSSRFCTADSDCTGAKCVNSVPSRCAPNTGTLFKSVLRQADGIMSAFPVLECVADMQVGYALDNNEDGDFQAGEGTAPNQDRYDNDISTLTAQDIIDRVKEVRVYIIAQEGQIDRTYTYHTSTITIPLAGDPAAGLGRTFDLSSIANGLNYRWKVYTLVVKTNNLR